jgi:hypothetical protein
MLDYSSLSREELDQISRFYDVSQFEAGRTTVAPYAEKLGRFYDTKTGYGYLDCIADPAKASLREDSYQDDKAGYVRLWLSLAHGHEGLYLEAFLWGSIGYVYPSSAVANRWTGVSPWNEFSIELDDGGGSNQVSDYHQTSMLPVYLAWLIDGTWNIFPESPFLMIWVSMALPFYMLLMTFCLIVRKRMRALLAVWAFPFVYWLSLSLGPVMCIRYVAPLFYCLPLIMCLPFLRACGEKKNGGGATNDSRDKPIVEQ